MARYTVHERQVITYAWDVDADDEEAAEATAHDGVPDGARTVRFASETWAEPAPVEV